MSNSARAVHLAERPIGLATDATWSVETSSIPPTQGAEVFFEPTYLSTDTAGAGSRGGDALAAS